jgi:hypothetical protein
MTRYEFYHILTPEEKMPRDPSRDLDLGDRYDPYLMMQEGQSNLELSVG